MKLSSAIEGYWLESKRNLSPNTVRDYDLTFRRLVAYTKDMEFEQITSDTLRKFLDYIAKKYKLANKTLANIWIALSALWSWAEAELNAPHILRKQIARPSYHLPAIEPYSRTEVAAILEHCEKTTRRSKHGIPYAARRPTAQRDRTLITILLDTGIRASELTALLISDYDSQRGRLLIRHGKGNKQRAIFLGNVSRKLLWKFLATRECPKPTDPIFTTGDGTSLDRNDLRHIIQRIAKNAGVTGATIHRFRHTFAINFLRNGGNLLQLKEMLGHEQMETLRIYAKLAEIDLAVAQSIASPADNWKL